MKLIAVSLAAVLVALAVAVQSAEVPITTVTPTRLPVSSTPTVQTTYAKDHGHHLPTAGSSTAAAAAATTASSNATTAATATHGVHSSTSTEPTTAKTSSAAATNATTPKSTKTEGHIALKQKLNTIAVKCKNELHAPQEIMALVSNTVVPQNEQQRCYLECVYKNLNLVKNNKFSVVDGKTLAQIRFADQPEEHKKAVNIIETCEKEAIIDTKTTEKCAAGRVIRNCFVKNGEKINFFPKA